MNKLNETIRTITLLGILCTLGVITYRLPVKMLADAEDTTRQQKAHACQYIGLEQAEKLLLNALPDSKVLDATPAIGDPGTDGCVTQVRMLADQSNPDSSGSVFVLPGGKHFLNGPLMNSETRLTVGAKTAQSDVAETVEGDMKSLETLTKMFGIAQSMDKQEPEVSSATPDIQPALSELMNDISSLPNQIVYNVPGERTAYIVFDPACSVCQKLFNQQSNLLAEKNVKMVWIPTYLAPQTQSQSAHLVKALSESQDKAKALMTLTMTTGTDAANLSVLFGEPSPADFAQLDKSAAYTRALLIDQKLGTPLIMYRSTLTNEIKIINGFNSLDDLADL